MLFHLAGRPYASVAAERGCRMSGGLPSARSAGFAALHLAAIQYAHAVLAVNTWGRLGDARAGSPDLVQEPLLVPTVFPGSFLLREAGALGII